MTILLEIPLKAGSSDQRLDVTIADIPLTLRALWNERFGYWSLSVAFRDGEELINNIKMVNNTPLFGRYRKLPLKGDFYFVHKSGKTYRPTYDDVGGEYGLYYYDPEVAQSLPVPSVPRGSTQSILDGGNSVWDSGASNWV